MAEKLYLIKLPEGIILQEGAVVVTKETRQHLYLALQEAKPVEELHSWADICKADKVFAVKEGS